jgi:hypothetical protein
MFMQAMRSIVGSKSKPWNIAASKCLRVFLSSSASLWCCCTYSAAPTRKPAVPQAGSQTVSVRGRRDELDHHADDVPRGAKLAVLPGRLQLREHVLVEVALGVAVGDLELVDEVDHGAQELRVRDHEVGVPHVLGVGRVLAAELAQEREHLVLDAVEQLAVVGELLERGPAQVLLFGPEDDAGSGGLPVRRALFSAAGLRLVEQAHEQQIGDLLDDGEGVGEAVPTRRWSRACRLAA